jgi:hypothetical protein
MSGVTWKTKLLENGEHQSGKTRIDFIVRTHLFQTFLIPDVLIVLIEFLIVVNNTHLPID